MPRTPLSARWIADGYTRHDRIAAGELHPALTFEYRPMLASDRAALLRRITQLAPEGAAGLAAGERLVLAELAARLVSWTLVDSQGALVEIREHSLQSVELHLLAELTTRVLGFAADDEDMRQQSDEQNLVRGVQLLLAAPHVATRDCAECQRFVFDERTGRKQFHGGLAVARPPGTQPPCRIPHVGCPKGTPENLRSLSTINQAAYRHYRECATTSRFPDDPLVRRHAALIDQVESQFRPHTSG